MLVYVMQHCKKKQFRCSIGEMLNWIGLCSV